MKKFVAIICACGNTNSHAGTYGDVYEFVYK